MISGSWRVSHTPRERFLCRLSITLIRQRRGICLAKGQIPRLRQGTAQCARGHEDIEGLGGHVIATNGTCVWSSAGDGDEQVSLRAEEQGLGSRTRLTCDIEVKTANQGAGANTARALIDSDLIVVG